MNELLSLCCLCVLFFITMAWRLVWTYQKVWSMYLQVYIQCYRTHESPCRMLRSNIELSNRLDSIFRDLLDFAVVIGN